MKKFSIKLTSLVATLAITASLLPMTVSAMATKGANLINDPGFESKTTDAAFNQNTNAWGDGYWISRNASNAATVAVATDIVHSGTKSVKVSGTSGHKASGPRAVLTNLEASKSYYVSAWVYTTEAGKKMKIGIGGADNAWSQEIQLTESTWTQVSAVLTAGTVGDAAASSSLSGVSAHTVYLNLTTNFYTFYVDDFEICEIGTAATPVAATGNLLTNAGFEDGTSANSYKDGWRTDAPVYVVEYSPADANSGNRAAHTTRRDYSYTTPQQYYEGDSLTADTYYYASAMVRLGSSSASTVKAEMVLQKETGTTVNANPADSSATEINESTYTKVASIIKNVDATKVKLYVNTIESGTDGTKGTWVDLWTDDYVLIPITASVAGATDVVPNSTITLNVPEDLADAELTIDKGAEIASIDKNGVTWTVTLDKMTYGVEYTLKLDTDLNQDPQWTFTTALDEANLLKNHDASFENKEALEVYENTAWSDNKWIARGTWELVSNEAHTGVKSVKVTGNSSKHTGPRAVLTSAEITEGKLYYVSAYVKTTDDALKVKIGLGGSAGWSKSHTLTKGVWNKVEGVIVAPAAGDAAVKGTISSITDGYALYINQDCDTLGTMWVDDFVIYEVDSYYEADFAMSDSEITCTFANYKNNNKLMLAVAAYDANGKMVYVDAALSTSAKGTLSVTAPSVAYTTAKVFLWDAATLGSVTNYVDLATLN